MRAQRRHAAWEETSVRQKSRNSYSEGEALKFTGLRQLTRQLKGLPPGPEGSMMKLVGTEMDLGITVRDGIARRL